MYYCGRDVLKVTVSFMLLVFTMKYKGLEVFESHILPCQVGTITEPFSSNKLSVGTKCLAYDPAQEDYSGGGDNKRTNSKIFTSNEPSECNNTIGDNYLLQKSNDLDKLA